MGSLLSPIFDYICPPLKGLLLPVRKWKESPPLVQGGTGEQEGLVVLVGGDDVQRVSNDGPFTMAPPLSLSPISLLP